MLLPLEYLQKHLFAAHTSCSQPTAAVEIGRLFLKRSLPIRTRDARIANYSRSGRIVFKPQETYLSCRGGNAYHVATSLPAVN